VADSAHCAGIRDARRLRCHRGSPLAGAEGGLSRLVPAFLLAIGVTANNPWILLVEILR
jgi:hypothetical protein